MSKPILPSPRKTSVGRQSVKLDAAIAGAAALGEVVGDRAARPEAAIEPAPPDRVGMAVDADDAGAAAHLPREPVEKRAAARADRGAAASELDLLAGQ